MNTGSCHLLATVVITLIAGLAFVKSHTILADDLIPTVSSLNAPAEVVFVDAGAVAACLEAARAGALCLSLDRVLNPSGRLANMRDVRWLLGSYGLTGDGQTVGIIDYGFNTSHADFGTTHRSITAVGSLSANSASNYHGASVSGILAADDDGVGPEGVADKADLRLCEGAASLLNTAGFNTLTTCMNDFTSNSAVVVNQSWGLNTFNADDLDAYISAYPSNTVTELFQYALTDHADANGVDDTWMDIDGSGLDSTMQTAITNYITALNNFQANGVIVQSNSNTTAEVDADIFAALPTFFSQLEEAWIAVVNIEVDGASGSESYTLMSDIVL